MTRRLSVDARLCSGQGRCYTLAHQLLECDDEGFVTIRGSTIEISDDQLDAAETAVRACPEDAITLTADD
jgi:ferredoxin